MPTANLKQKDVPFIIITAECAQNFSMTWINDICYHGTNEPQYLTVDNCRYQWFSCKRVKAPTLGNGHIQCEITYIKTSMNDFNLCTTYIETHRILSDKYGVYVAEQLVYVDYHDFIMTRASLPATMVADLIIEKFEEDNK